MRKSIGIPLLTIIIVLVSFSVTTPARAIDKEEFLFVSVSNPTIPQGATETLTISLTDTDCAPALYAMFVFSPGDLDQLKGLGHDFIQWLTDFDGTPIEFWNQLEDWKDLFDTLSLDIGWKGGMLTILEPSDAWVYPDDFDAIVGTLGTFEQGEYDVVAVGVGVEGCFHLCIDCFSTSFFVIPEVPLGTIAPVVSSLGSLGLLRILTKRRREE